MDRCPFNRMTSRWSHRRRQWSQRVRSRP
ncbi:MULTISPECIES: hypothetical protein [Plesiomonas]